MSEQSGAGRSPVVVVGAGPCGLVAACELLRSGVDVRVLEAAEAAGTGSRAIILWPPTLEVLDELGVLDEARSRGVTAKGLAYHMGDGKTMRIELGAVNEPLLLPQEETGRLLLTALERLGGQVEYGVRVTGVEDGGDHVTVRAQGPDGTEETIEAGWVIGADGVGSTVRQRLGVEFAGDRVPTTFLLAEGEVDGDFPREEVHYHLGTAGVMLLSPLPGGKVRVSGPVAPDMPMTPEAVQALLEERGPGGLTYRAPSMIGTFTSQERIAATLRSGRVFLVGDAAHVHSAVGGQGLNLGVQDSRNLGWKLAGVVRGTLDPAVLDSYGTERRAVAEQVVQATGKMIRQAVVGPVAARVRNAVWTLMQVTGVLRNWYAPMLAGRLTRYPDVLFGAPTPTGRRGRAPRGLPAPGSRTPAWAPAPEPADTGFRLLTLGAEGSGLERDAGALAARLQHVMTHHHLPGRKAGFVLLRPDGFVAASGTTAASLTAMAALLDAVVLPPRAERPGAGTAREAA
jgi:2-polyprenyl-6-methoxyphenol hydroxylase-like FAD-dependent oxidoreductase